METIQEDRETKFGESQEHSYKALYFLMILSHKTAVL